MQEACFSVESIFGEELIFGNQPPPPIGKTGPPFGETGYYTFLISEAWLKMTIRTTWRVLQYALDFSGNKNCENLIHLFLYLTTETILTLCYWKCNFPRSPNVCLLVGW